MKTAAIFHGQNCNPNLFWYKDTGKALGEKGYKVWIPALPNATQADLKDWLPFVLESEFEFTPETILIGDSAGATLILSILQNIDQKIAKAILVGASIDRLNDGLPRAILQEQYDWEKIKDNTQEVYIINSDNDPYGAGDEAGRKIFDKVGGFQIIAHGQGHFGTIKLKQEYPEFPLLKKLI
jgi:hypothetical protein